MDMKPKMTFLASACLAATGFLSHANAQEQTIRIATVNPLSGPSAHMGKDNENGARMAIDELNAKGIMIGGRKAVFQLQSEDDGADPKQATAVAAKLVDAKVAAVIGHLNSGTSIPASKIYNDAGIPMISPASTNPKLTAQGYKSIFRVVTSDEKMGTVLGAYAAETLKAKTVAIIDDRTAYGQGVADEFGRGATAAGMSIVARQYTSDKATDFSAILTAVKAKKPDVIFYGGMDAVGGPMLRQMKQLNINARFMGGDGVCTGALPKLAGDGIGEGNVICGENGGIEEANRAALNDFKSAYEKRYGIAVVYNAAYAYDATMAVAAAMQKAGSADPAKYLAAMSGISFKGKTGEIAFDGKGDLRNGAVSIFTYVDGHHVLKSLIR
jgi:branched-chain amino acid transport system substrate-binding protein